MIASCKIELYSDGPNDLDIEELATALRTFLHAFEATKDTEGKIIVKIPGWEYRLNIKECEN